MDSRNKNQQNNNRRTLWSQAEKRVNTYKSKGKGHKNTPEIIDAIFICIGEEYKQMITNQREKIEISDFINLIKTVQVKGNKYKVFLCPKDAEALHNFKERHSNLIKLIPDENNVNVLEWRKTPQWQRNGKKYDELRQREDKSKIINEKIMEDAIKRLSSDSAEIQETVVCEVKDVLSLLADQNEDGSFNTVVNLLYPGSLLNSMDNALKNAVNMGFNPESLVHMRYNLEDISNSFNMLAEEKEESTESVNSESEDNKELLDMTSLLLKAGMKADMPAENIAKIYGHLYKENKSKKVVGHANLFPIMSDKKALVDSSQKSEMTPAKKLG